ncbi:unnamed protein product, partial [Candidula unifasciata]
ELLELMGLYSKPKPKSNEKIIQSASKFMRNLYESIKDVDSSEYPSDDTRIHISSDINASALGLDPVKVEGADIIVSYVNNVRKVSTLRHERDSTFYFEVPLGEEIKGAELRLFKEVSSTFTSGIFTINLYVIRQGPDWDDKILEPESSIDVKWDTTGWLMLDATKAAGNWTSGSYLNMGLYLRVLDFHGNLLDPQDIGIVGRRGPADKQSFLVGYIGMSRELQTRTRSFRNKRWAENDGKSYADNPYSEYTRAGYPGYRAHNNCQRHNLYISFRDIGFDQEFLIAPEGYSAFYCSGDCSFPLGIHMNATNHAIVQTLVHLMDPYHVPKPCCAPTKFGTITLLYYDDNSSVVLRRFRDMIVTACGCH